MKTQRIQRPYICRRCETIRDATWKEIEFGRIVCYQCGGTCDPTAAEQRRINTVGVVAREQAIRQARFSAGW